MTQKAAFSFDNYVFKNIALNLDAATSDKLDINFQPSGVFRQRSEESSYTLSLIFTAKDREDENAADFIHIECEAVFTFSEKISYGEIPPFFYANSIAILFPYIRSFISTLTLQANVNPLVLPPMNLTSLADPLKANTTICNE